MTQENQTVEKHTPSKALLAGRIFKREFDKLGSGDRARLRRADDPRMVGVFWDCFKAAQKEDTRAYVPLYAAIVPLLDLLKQADDEENVGKFLAKHHNKVALRRVEALFGIEHFNELLENLESLFTLLKESDIDYGRLVTDLSAFNKPESRTHLYQRWATSYFKNI